MHKRLFKGDHPDVASSLNNLAALLQAQGKLADAEPLFQDALDMPKRLFKGDHPDVATSLNNLAVLLPGPGEAGRRRATLQRRPGHEQAAVQGRPPRRGHQPEQPGATCYQAQGKLADAEPLYRTPWTCESGCSRATTPTWPTA